MKLLVNGEIKELNIYDNNGIEWSNDLIGNNTFWSDYKTDEETELKIVDEDFFDWWKEYIENYTADEAEMRDLATEYDLDIDDIKMRIADEMDGIDMEQEHYSKQSVFEEIRKEQEAIKLVASLYGKKGGSVKSAAKAKASAENGKLGGRPRKSQ